MTEDFLYYIWQFKLFDNPLITWDGEKVFVEKPGLRNVNAGPDFLNASLKIGEISWHGNVEIHVKTSDWHLHGHDYDPNYENLILHVVYHHDTDEMPHDCPLVEMNSRIPLSLFENYKNLQITTQFIPCENLFYKVDEFTKSSFLEALYIQRLEEWSRVLEQRLERLHGDWEALMFERISYVFGLKVNADAFEMLAKSFPFKNLQEINRKAENLEAFLFGQAGYLNKPADDFHQMLANEYQFLKHKYNLKSLENHHFKLLRLRPPNFPTIRISQLSNLYANELNLFSKILTAQTLNQLNDVFLKVKASAYWNTHYTFGNIAKTNTEKWLTQQRIQLIILNAVVPIKYLYAKKYGADNIEDLLNIVREIKPENNSIIQSFKQIGAQIKDAVDSQAYLELKKHYCDSKKCLNCRIGNKIIHDVR